MANLENINEIEKEQTADRAERNPKQKRKMHWFFKLFISLFIGIFILILTLFIALNLSVTKNWIAQKGLDFLNKDFKTNISASSVEINYFGDVVIHGLKVKDDRGLDFLKAESVVAESDWISLVKDAINGTNSFNFKKIALNNADVQVITYKGDSTANFIKFIELFDDGKPRDPKKPLFKMAASIEIHNSKLSIINQNSEGDAGKWLVGTSVNMSIPSLKIAGPDINADLQNLSFTTERWGKTHKVERFAGLFSLTNTALSFKELVFDTDHSLLKGDISFNLDEKTKWQDFNNRVIWDLKFDNETKLSGYDISYFVTNWDNYTPLSLQGKMYGVLNDFKLQNFMLGNDRVNIRAVQTHLANLLDGDLQIKASGLSTDFTYKDLKAMFPSFIAQKMKNFADDFGRLKFNGNVEVNPKQVYINKGNLITGIGNAEIRNFYLNDFSTDIPRYSGDFNIQNLNTSAITKSKQVGNLSGTFHLRGRSFDVNTMVLETTSHIASIELMGKNIKNLSLNGTLNRKQYNGEISINDPNAQAHIKGLIDFSTSRLFANVEAHIKHLDVHFFSGQKGRQIVSGDFKGKVAMTDINDLTLDASLHNIHYFSEGQKMSVPSVEVNTYINQGNRVISINAPNAINGKIEGQFNLADLAGMVQNGAERILVSNEPKKVYKGQFFNAEFTIGQQLTDYFMPELKLTPTSPITLSYDGNTNNLKLSASMDKIVYTMKKKQSTEIAKKALEQLKISTQAPVKNDSIVAEQITLNIDTENPEDQIFARAKRLQYGDNVFNDFSLYGENEYGEKLHLSTSFKFGSKTDEKNNSLKSYYITLNQTLDKEGNYIFKFAPTHLKFNNITWSIDTSEDLEQSITYKKKTGEVLVENIRIYSDDSSLYIKNAHYKSASNFEAEGEVSNLQVSKLFEMQSGGNSMDFQGVANGNFHIVKNETALEPLININIEGMKMGGRDMGSLSIDANKTDIPNIYDIGVRLKSSGLFGGNKLDIVGTVDNNQETPTLDISANMNDFDLAFSQQFVTGIFSNMRGKANGTIRISGALDDIDYSGDINLSKFGFTLDFTGVDYAFDDTVIPLSKGFVVLNDIRIKDNRANSDGSISGFIRFDTLASMGVNLLVRAENLLVLDSNQNTNDLFWGRVYANGDLYISGPVTGLDISTPNMKALNGSAFAFNSSSTSSVEEFKMLRFLQREDSGAIVLAKKKATGANVNVDFTLSVDKGTNVSVLLGESVGNINVKGESERLRFQLSRTGVINLSGDYYVDNGSFVSKAILERTFQIAKGSNLKWDGNAMTPQLGIKANYNRTVTNLGQYLGTSTLPPVNIQLTVNISGTLNAPDISFDVAAPEVSSQIKETLASKMTNEDEKILQFGSVLALSSFNISNSGSLDINTNNASQSIGYNLAFKQLTSALNTISDDVKLDIDYLKGDQAANTADRANASAHITVSPRVSIKTALGVPIAKTQTTTNNYLSGEGTIEYDWSKNNDGSRLFRVYSKPSNIGLIAGSETSANQAYGIGVVYTKSFNRFFPKKTDKQKQNEQKKDSISDKK